jgi:hypothetical protein
VSEYTVRVLTCLCICRHRYVFSKKAEECVCMCECVGLFPPSHFVLISDCLIRLVCVLAFVSRIASLVDSFVLSTSWLQPLVRQFAFLLSVPSALHGFHLVLFGPFFSPFLTRLFVHWSCIGARTPGRFSAPCFSLCRARAQSVSLIPASLFSGCAFILQSIISDDYTLIF